MVCTGEDSFCIDMAVSFGLAPSAGVYGHVADAGADLFRYQGIGPLIKWVDDHAIFRIHLDWLQWYNQQRQSRHERLSLLGLVHEGGRLWYEENHFTDGTLYEHIEDCRFPCLDLSTRSPRSPEDALFTYNFEDIDRLSSSLGIPWEKYKDLPFASSSSYIGFQWNLDSLTVSLSTKKSSKYIICIEEWLLHPNHTLSDVQKLYGKLLHVCLVLPAGRSYLTAMLGLCNPHLFTLYLPSKGISDDLSWWITKLSSFLSRPIPVPLQLIDLHAFSDASSGIGIVISIQGRWRAWRLIPGWQILEGFRDIEWAEAIGFELLVRTIPRIKGSSGHFKVHGDNKGIVEGWRNFRRKNRPTNQVFRRIHSFLKQFNHSLSIHSAYIPSKDNPADPPSRGLYPSIEYLLPEIQLPSDLDWFIVDATRPFSHNELRLFREGRYPSALAQCIKNSLTADSPGPYESAFLSPFANTSF